MFDSLDAATFLVDDRFDRFDLVYADGALPIFNKERFHQVFGYYEGLLEFAEGVMPQLKAAVPMENFDEFQAACLSDKTLLKRLRRTIGAMRPSFDMPRVAKTVAEQKIEVKLAGTETKPLLVLDKNKKYVFFTLLEDGFLRSSLADDRPTSTYTDEPSVSLTIRSGLGGSSFSMSAMRRSIPAPTARNAKENAS